MLRKLQRIPGAAFNAAPCISTFTTLELTVDCDWQWLSSLSLSELKTFYCLSHPSSQSVVLRKQAAKHRKSLLQSSHQSSNPATTIHWLMESLRASVQELPRINSAPMQHRRWWSVLIVRYKKLCASWDMTQRNHVGECYTAQERRARQGRITQEYERFDA